MVSEVEYSKGVLYQMYKFIRDGEGRVFDDAYTLMMDGIVQSGDLYYLG